MENDPVDIPNWQRIGPWLTTSGRLGETDLDKLAALGVRRIINLALIDSPGILADEESHVAARGLAYAHIPVPFDAPQEAHFAMFCAIMAENGDAPVHVHCAMNWRVSAFLYRWNREVRGMAESEARALMEQQWSPGTSDNEHAPAWARFVSGVGPERPGLT